MKQRILQRLCRAPAEFACRHRCHRRPTTEMGKVRRRQMGKYKGGRTGGGRACRRAMGKFLKGRPTSTKEERQA
eukprot:5783919-Prorocentrum_lima.AAC.1